ncbi:hypothetical protein Tco_1552370 [Tanacetum coccineum]
MKGVRFSALYLQNKRNLLVFDHSHQHSSYFRMLTQPFSGSTYIRLYGYSLVQSKMATSYAIFEGEKWLVRNPPLAAPYVPPTDKELEILFQPMFDEYFESSTVDRLEYPILLQLKLQTITNYFRYNIAMRYLEDVSLTMPRGILL